MPKRGDAVGEPIPSSCIVAGMGSDTIASVTLARQRVVESFQEHLEPLIGGTMARASVAAQCKHLGIEGQEITRDDGERLVERIAKAMKVFVGPEQAVQVAQELRDMLDEIDG